MSQIKRLMNELNTDLLEASRKKPSPREADKAAEISNAEAEIEFAPVVKRPSFPESEPLPVSYGYNDSENALDVIGLPVSGYENADRDITFSERVEIKKAIYLDIRALASKFNHMYLDKFSNNELLYISEYLTGIKDVVSSKG